MKRLLHIDASPRGDRSHSRRLSRELVETLRQYTSLEGIEYRDVGRQPIPPVTEQWIAAAFTPLARRTPEMREALRLSDELVDELIQADTLVIGAPMYNFGIPASLKAYVDQVVRVGRTFLFEPDDPERPYKPLLKDKRTFVIVATGDAGYEPGGPFEALNHVDRYLRTVFGFIGITDLCFVHVGNDEFGGAKLETSLRRAREELACLARRERGAAEPVPDHPDDLAAIAAARARPPSSFANPCASTSNGASGPAVAATRGIDVHAIIEVERLGPCSIDGCAALRGVPQPRARSTAPTGEDVVQHTAAPPARAPKPDTDAAEWL